MNESPASLESDPSSRARPHRGIRDWWPGLLAVAIALGFALYTNHVWEDYYITFKSSKNLATGEGLVYHPGERLHTFTSPLGVLLPALSSLLAFNASDTAALWIFRLLSAGALGGAALLLLRFARGQGYGVPALAVLVGLLLTDAKTVDFSINGMETAWMMLFLAYTVWAAYSGRPDAWKHLGVAWAGLMWTRPDSFIYIAALSAGVWLFNHPSLTGLRRPQWIAAFLKAGLVTTALYLPWFLFAWAYYGTPVPHTVEAKSMMRDTGGLVDLLWTAVSFPWAGLEGQLALDSTFLPSYFDMGGWPAWAVILARTVALVCALVWLHPRVSPEARAFSFTFFCGQVYLWHFPYHPFPWYVPTTTFFAIATLGALFHQAARFARHLDHHPETAAAARSLRRHLAVAAALLLLASCVQLLGVARQAEAQQRLIEDGNRRKIGEWLRENARPGDSVFMEPLGYIGYFSGLKTLDFPGLSSREMVAARALFNNDFRYLVLWLEPTWLVLRPREAENLVGYETAILGHTYEKVRTFSVKDEVTSLEVPGRAYLEFDSEFIVFRRKHAGRHELEGTTALSPFPAAHVDDQPVPATFMHAPGALVIPIPAEANRVTLHYGFAPDAYRGEKATDGANFEVFIASEGRPTSLHQRVLTPATVEEDRGLHAVTLDLPRSRPPGASLVLRSDPHGHASFDWTLWSRPAFAP